jgi:HAMP domain-containing protein
LLLLAAAAAALRFWPGRPIDRLERALAPETAAALPSISPPVPAPPDLLHPAGADGGSS